MGFFDGAAGGIIGGSIGAIGSFIGGNQSSNNAQALANMNYQAQKEFAQNGIRWRVADAEAAGIHPLYALGASTNSYSPVSSYGGDNGISDAFAQLGNGFSQGFDRAAQAKMTKEERAIAQAQLERQEAMQLADQNMRQKESDAKILMYRSEALRNYAAARQSLSSQQATPAMPSLKVRPDGTIVGQTIAGQGDSSPINSSSVFSSHGGGLIEIEPAKTTANALGYAGTEAAAIRDRGWAATDDGGYASVKSDQLADRQDDDWIGNIGWHMRNTIPAFMDSQDAAPPRSWLPRGASKWIFNSRRNAWYPNTHKYGHQLRDFMPWNWK
nr:minor tail protein [Cressdnaviricota sp.]